METRKIIIIFVLLFSFCKPKGDESKIHPKEAIKKNEASGRLFQKYLLLDEDEKLIHEAIDSVNLAINLDSTNSVFYYNKVNYLTAIDSISQAIKVYDKLIKIDPTQAAALFERGTLLDASGKKELAKESYLDALDQYNRKLLSNPKFKEDILVQRAILYLYLYGKEEAMLEIEKLIRSNPTNENYLFTKENILRFNSDSF
jgi:tetratricopeptide (TPR) repeat protein